MALIFIITLQTQLLWADPLRLACGPAVRQNSRGQWIDAKGRFAPKPAAAKLPPLKGKSVAATERILQRAGFTRTKVSNSPARNQTWNHPDGSEVRIHPYGNQDTTMSNGQPTPKSGVNAHVYRQSSSGHELNDQGNISVNPADTHIGIRNPADLPTVRGRPHGSGA